MLYDIRGYSDWVDSKMAKFSQRERFLSCVTGLFGEVGEYSDLFKKRRFHFTSVEPEKVLKELGDILFYWFGCIRYCGMNVAKVFWFETWRESQAHGTTVFREFTDDELVLQSGKWVGKICEGADQVLKGLHFSDGGQVPAYMVYALQVTMNRLSATATREGFTLQEVMEANVRKLDARYPGGFDASRAHKPGETPIEERK